MSHGYSNVLAGLLGTVPNYLVSVNTVMLVSCLDDSEMTNIFILRFYRVGGGSRLSGLMLAAGTVVLLVVGTGPIGYIRKLDFSTERNKL
jgi:SulP family sulfate permease